MGVLTDYFVADNEQLAIVFAGWNTVADKPIIREVKNPFTGKLQRVEEWRPAHPIATGDPANPPDLTTLSHVRWKRVDLVKLVMLDGILTGVPFEEALRTFVKPALVHPTDEDIGMNEVPLSLTSALQPLSDGAVDVAATKWHQTQEMKLDKFTLSDCKAVLQSFRLLAQQCSPRRRMYLLWSL